jgi:hypothetical protein
MERSLGDHAAVYRDGPAARAARLSRALSLGGAALIGGLGRRRWAAAAGGAAVLAGSLCLRISVWRAGTESAELTGGPAGGSSPLT